MPHTETWDTIFPLDVFTKAHQERALKKLQKDFVVGIIFANFASDSSWASKDSMLWSVQRITDCRTSKRTKTRNRQYKIMRKRGWQAAKDGWSHCKSQITGQWPYCINHRVSVCNLSDIELRLLFSFHRIPPIFITREQAAWKFMPHGRELSCRLLCDMVTWR